MRLAARLAAGLALVASVGVALAAGPTPQTSQVPSYNTFTQTARAPDVAVTSTTQDVALGASAPVAAVFNIGSNYAYVALNSASGTVTAATGIPIPPGSCSYLNASGMSHAQAITSSGTTTLQISLGWGNQGGGCGGTASPSSPIPTVSGQVTPSGPTSGVYTITTGGTAQNLFASGEVAHGCGIQNPPNATENLYVNAYATAVAGVGNSSFVLPAGTSYTCPGGLTTAVSVIANTGGHAFQAQKW